MKNKLRNKAMRLKKSFLVAVRVTEYFLKFFSYLNFLQVYIYIISNNKTKWQLKLKLFFKELDLIEKRRLQTSGWGYKVKVNAFFRF